MTLAASKCAIGIKSYSPGGKNASVTECGQVNACRFRSFESFEIIFFSSETAHTDRHSCEVSLQSDAYEYSKFNIEVTMKKAKKVKTPSFLLRVKVAMSGHEATFLEVLASVSNAILGASSQSVPAAPAFRNPLHEN